MQRTLIAVGAVGALLSSAFVVTGATPVAATEPLAIVVDVEADSPGTCPSQEPATPTCSLRSAVELANDHAGSTVFLSTGLYVLTAPIQITADATTVVGATLTAGSSAADFTVDAAGGQGFVIDADGVALRGITITGASKSNGNGGAVLVKKNSDGFLLADSSIESSHARHGGAVFVDGAGAEVRRSTFVGNSAIRKGGAIRVMGDLQVVNSTFTQNLAQSGGAISVAGSAAISFSTFVDNTSNNEKGAGVDRNGGSVFVTGSILTRANQQSADGSDCSGNPDLVGPNYVGNAQGCNPDESVLIGTDVGMLPLGELGDYLGPTRTIPLLDDVNVAVDLAGADACREIGLDGLVTATDPAVGIDQRGFARPVGAGCEIGAFEAIGLDIELDLSADTATPFVGARFLPGSAIAENVIETHGLFGGSLDASPLNTFPLESAPLNAFPLNAFPLNAFPLNTFPLNAFFTAAAPLNTFPLNAFPLNAFPLNTFPLSDLVLVDGTWDDLLDGTEFEGVPLQSLTLDDVSGVAAVQALGVEQLNLEGTPLNAFPLSAFLLGSIPLNTFPLNAFAADDPSIDDWCDVFVDFCASGGVDPQDDAFTLASVALAGAPLNTFPLNAFPLNAFPLNAFPLNAFPLNTFPLNTFVWQASPLNAFPLNAFPLNTFDGPTVIDCSLLPGATCDGATLLDAAVAGAFTPGATLGALGDLFLANPGALAALGDYTLADLLNGLIPADAVPWNELDLTVPGLQNAAPPDEWTFHYLADVSLTAPAAELAVDLTLPAGFAYVPGGSALGGAPIGDPTLSCPGGACVDPAGIVQPITLTYELTDVPPGESTLEIATRAGFELGPATAVAGASGAASAGAPPVTADPSSYTVTVIAPPDGPDVPIVIDTVGSGPCASDGTGDVNLGWVASTTDGVDFYRFDIGAATAACGARADIFLSNLPVDYDLVLYGAASDPLRGDPSETIAYLDDVTLDLNPFDDVIQADTVQDIPQVLPASLIGVGDPADFGVAAISSNRAQAPEHIRTGTLRAGTYFLQVTGYNGAEADTPYALRLRIDGTVSRGPCDALPYPGVGSEPDIVPLPLPLIGDLPDDLNTLFLVNTQLLEHTYGPAAAGDVVDELGLVAAARSAGVSGVVIPVDADASVRDAYEDRAADPCDPERSNDVVRAIGDLIDTYTVARPDVEYVVLVGDDRQIPMANIVDDANFANERTFAQEFAAGPNNESIAALAAGRYRSDDPYGTEAGIRVRDHELFIPTRAVGRLVESPTEIIGSLQNFVTYGGQLDPDTESREALQTGYEFLGDGAQLNADNLTAAGYTVDELIDPTWTDDTLVSALERSPTDPHLDLIGVHAHFDQDNALPAFDNFNPPVTDDELFNSAELPDNIRRAVVYSMGCHSSYSLSDVQVGAPTPDWAQALTGFRTNAFIGNTGYGYGDTDRVALTEQLTAIFAAEVGQDGSIGHAWADAKQRMISEILVLDAYQEKALQQFVFYGLPMFHVGTAPPDLTGASSAAAAAPAAGTPDIDPVTGQPVATVEFQRNLPLPEFPEVPQFERVDAADGSYYQVDGRTLTVNGHPIQPLYAADVPSFDGLSARDALITELTSVDVDESFDPLFFWASPNFGGPRPEYLDGSFPAEMASVRSRRLDGQESQQVLVAAGQYRGDDLIDDFGTQRLHTSVETLVYYSDSSDFTAPAISLSLGQFDDDAILFDVEVDDTTERVYVLYRATGENIWSSVDLVERPDGSWTGVGPFSVTQPDTRAEYIVQAVDGNGNVAMSNSKSRYFLAATPGEVSSLALEAAGALVNGWYTGDVIVSAVDGGEQIEYRVDAGPFAPYVGPVTILGSELGPHIVTAFDETGAFAALDLKIDSVGPTITLEAVPDVEWSNQPPIVVTIAADDGNGSGVAAIRYTTDGTNFTQVDFDVADPKTVDVPIGDDGITTLAATAIDVAGNESVASESVVIQIDTAAPFVPTLLVPPSVSLGAPIDAEYSCGDDLSGVAGCELAVAFGAEPFIVVASDPAGGVVTVPSGLLGTYTVQVTATDNAGNTTTESATYDVVDVTPPVATVTVEHDPIGNGDANTVTFSCTDAESGIATCDLELAPPGGNFTTISTDTSGTVPVPTDQLGTYTVRVTATDNAGNTTTESATYDVVDVTPPVATVTVEHDSVVTGSPNTATFTCSDTQSGIATCELDVAPPGGNFTTISTDTSGTVPVPTDQLGTYTVRFTATDNAGNTTTGIATYDVTDDTPPTATLTVEHDTVDILGDNTATFACADAESGIATCELDVAAPGGNFTTISTDITGVATLPTDSIGTYDVLLTATDVAGNTATAVGSYVVQYCVNEQYDSTQAKTIGSNYTIRIELCDADGNNISSRQIVLTAVSVTDANGVSFPPGPNDSGQANDGFEFRYRQKGYIYNLDTTNFPWVEPGNYTLDFTAEPVPDPANPPPPSGNARFTLRL